MNKIINEIIKNKTECYFISPHLDDAALSAGGLIQFLSSKVNVTVITIFTKGSDSNTLSAKQFLKQCGYKDSNNLFTQRNIEDIKAFKNLDIRIVHLQYKDALWRERNNLILRKIGKIIPELSKVYPIYKLNIIKGKIAKSDYKLSEEISLRIKELINNKYNFALFAPTGIGNHVDHVLTRNISEKITKPIFWADQPYYMNSNVINKNYLEFEFNEKSKIKILNNYNTQIKAMFQNNIPNLKEYFLINN